MKSPIIIAEAGVNHNGDFDLALRMVEAAKDAGADYIKFQTFKAEKLVTPDSITADYQKANNEGDSQMEMLRRLELSFEDFKTIALYCKEVGIGFLSTPFDRESIKFLADMGMDYMKVPSGEITNLPYLREIAATGIPAIISTGMCGLEDIRMAIDVFYKAGYKKEQLTLLQCNTEYPTPMRDVNLKAMVTIRKEFDVATGYSDHTKGYEVAIAATSLEAAVIEKHFTLSRKMKGPDHQASLEPEELAAMISAIRNVSEALGSGEKRVTESEKKNMAIARKSIVAARNIKKGETFTEENLTTKRPGTGLSPMLWWDKVIGMEAGEDFPENSLITI